MNAPVTTWTLTESTARAPIRVSTLTADDGTEARYRVERLSSGRLIVQVRFQSATESPAGKLYARAHAARMLAQVLDTLGDFLVAGDEPLEVDDDVSLVGCTVELAGPGAVLASAGFFGEAADELFNTYA